MRTLLICTLFLEGCGAPYVREGNSETALVYWGDGISREGALVAADAHCAKYGESARYHKDAGEFTVAYDCVKPTK